MLFRRTFFDYKLYESAAVTRMDMHLVSNILNMLTRFSLSETRISLVWSVYILHYYEDFITMRP